ncbi:MAG: hypothetical protein OIF56_15025 [Cohaesibacter sp.]|nr:hypothetical protein [Cohaesibacter sp.]
MSWTKQDLANLKKAIGLGALETQIGGERVRYRSLAEMKEIKAMMEEELSGNRCSEFIETIYES